tara:strand:- start:2124 stop:2882 length:759 start_codon:yes stop_codon:yes gene_type:complete
LTKALLRVDFFFLFLLQRFFFFFFFFFFFVSFPSQKNRDHHHHHVDASKKSSVFFFRCVDDCVRVGGGRVVFLVFRCVRFRFWRVSSSSPFRKRHVRFLSFVKMNPIVETCQRCSFPRRSTPKGPKPCVPTSADPRRTTSRRRLCVSLLKPNNNNNNNNNSRRCGRIIIARNRKDEFEASHFNRYSRCIRIGGHDGCVSWIWNGFAIPGGGGRRRVTWHPKRRGFEHRVTNDSWIGERTSSVSLFRGELFEV